MNKDFLQQATFTQPVYEITKEELTDPQKAEECLEHVMYANRTYRIKTKDDKDVLMLPVPKAETYAEHTIELSDSDYNTLLREAHRRDITFNQLVTILLNRYLEKDSD